MAAIRGDKTLVELAEQYKVHPNQIGQWRLELLERAAEVFATAGREARRRSGPEDAARQDRAAGVGERFFGRRARSHRRCERKAMIDATHELPIVRQAQLLDLSRSTVYYLPQPTSDADLALMRRIDELHLEHPFAGSRMLRDLLNREGIAVGRKHVATLMRRMGIEALYQRPRTSGRHRAHPGLPVSAARPHHRPARIRSGRWTRPTSRCAAASSI